MPMFSKQHYAAIATLLRHGRPGFVLDEGQKAVVADSFADMFEKDNPLFDRSRFMNMALGWPRELGHLRRRPAGEVSVRRYVRRVR